MLYQFQCEHCDNDEITEEIMSIKESEENPPICPICSFPMTRMLGKINKHISWGLWAASDNAGRKN